MIDLHTHSLLSDGELLPSELVRRAAVKGYKVLGITDHVDSTNMEAVIPAILKLVDKAYCYDGITVVPGVELTHVPRRLIKGLILRARELGAFYVVVHGETIAEPVEEGTNREAIEGGADILAHPGLITEEDVSLAKERNVLLEITARKGHSLSNGHVARLAEKIGTRLVINTDSHSPFDLVNDEEARTIVLGAGLSSAEFDRMQHNAAELVTKIREGKR
jgi:putative hydrolase